MKKIIMALGLMLALVSPTIARSPSVAGEDKAGPAWADPCTRKAFRFYNDGIGSWCNGSEIGLIAGGPSPASMTIPDPDGLQPTMPDIPIFEVSDSWAPNGITITRLAIKTNASSTYSVTFEKWDDAVGSTQTELDIVATSTASEVEVESGFTNSTVAAGEIVFATIPATDVGWVQLIVEFTVDMP